MSGVLLTIFQWTDKGIGATNRDRAPAEIWGNMDDEDLGVLVDVMIGGAKKSRIVATTVRKLSSLHSMLRLGLITGPRFMQTVKHYQNHGGFILPFGGALPLEVRAE